MPISISAETVERAAKISSCGRYRYMLSRTWNPSGPTVNFVGLNPSTADAHKDDPTIRRCIGYAREWGFGGIAVTNLYALRSTDPGALHEVRDPIGPENDAWLARCAFEADLILVCWGSNALQCDRPRQVAGLLARQGELFCLRVNRDREPTHPLYLPKRLQPASWPPAR